MATKVDDKVRMLTMIMVLVVVLGMVLVFVVSVGFCHGHGHGVGDGHSACNGVGLSSWQAQGCKAVVPRLVTR